MTKRDFGASRVRHSLANTALVFASLGITCLLVFAAGEAYFRIKYKGAVGAAAETSLYEFDRQRGWRLRPGEYLRFNYGSHRAIHVAINEWGLRERALAAKAPAGKERVSIVGDSFVFAEALNAPNRFTGQLQSLAGPQYEVINISVPGYGTGQQLRLLQELISKGFQIGEKIVLVFFTNDIQDNLGLTYSTLEADPQKLSFDVDEKGNLLSVVPKEKKKDSQSASPWMRSLFYNFLKRRMEVAATRYPWIFVALDTAGLAPKVPRTPGIIAGWYGAGWEQRWAATVEILDYFANYVGTQLEGTELQIAFVPSPLQVEDVFQVMISRNMDMDIRFAEFFGDIDRPQRMLRKYAEERNIPFIDMTPLLRKASGTYFPSEGHLSEVGSEIAAKAIYENAFERK